MTPDRFALRSIAACAATLGLLAAPLITAAQTTAPKPAAKVVKKAGPVKAAEPLIGAASPEQIEAAERVYYGVYQCEFNQSIDIVASGKHASYVDVKHGKANYLMKPVLSSTGAIRLEDVRGDTLMVQIASKSMLLNVKTGTRVVDDCISPKQREQNDAAQAAKSAPAAVASAGAQMTTAVPPAETK